MEVLIKNEISYEDFMKIVDEERKFRQLTESIRMMNSQRSDTEKKNLVEEGKKIDIDELIKDNEIINKNRNSQI